jgi:hypothetical protein
MKVLSMWNKKGERKKKKIKRVKDGKNRRTLVNSKERN